MELLKLPKRVTVTEKQRNKLVKFGLKLGEARGELVTIVHPDPLRRWIREANKPGKTKPAKVSRPRTEEEISELIIKLARENDLTVTHKSRPTPACSSGRWISFAG